MDRQAIEQTAVNAVEDRVNLTRFLSSYLDNNDKTPSWDGTIYIFKSNKKTKDNLTGTIPVQIKGHEYIDFSKDTISYSIDIADLRNYLNDGGAILFVVYVKPNEDQTDFLKKIYFIELTPVRINALIQECPVVQQKKAVHLKAVPSKPDDFASMVLNCYLNCKRQASFAGAKLPTVKELTEQGVLESIQVFVSGYGDEYKGYQGFLKLDTPLYVNIKGSAIPQPLQYQGEMIHKTIAYDVFRDISSMGTVFYRKYRVVETLEECVIHIGYGIRLTLFKTHKGCKFNFKASHKLREFVSDAPFMIAFAQTRQLMIGEMPLDFSQCEFDDTSFRLEEHKADYQRLKRYVEMLDMQGCKDDIDITKLSNEDWRNLERLTQATLDGKTVSGLRDDFLPIMAMNVGPLRFGVELTPVEGVQGEYKLCHIQDCKDIVWSAPDHSEAFPVPNCAIFKPDDYVTLSNIKYDQILPAIKAFPVNAHTYGVANQIMLNLIAASDKADGTRKEILLQTALSIADWLASLPDDVWEKSIATLNRMQIIKRQRSLTEEERGMLYALALGIGSREDVRFAAYALLGKRDEAIKHFSTLPPSAQEELKLYPIYRFAEMN